MLICASVVVVCMCSHTHAVSCSLSLSAANSDKGDGVPEADWGNYKLLCRDGSTAPFEDAATCNLGYSPAQVLLTSGKRTAAEIAVLQKDIMAAAALPAFASLFFATASGAMPNKEGFVFKERTRGLIAVQPSVVDYIGTAYSSLNAVAAAYAAPLQEAVEPPSSTTTTTTGGSSGKGSSCDGTCGAMVAFIVLFVASLLASACTIHRLRKSNKALSKELRSGGNSWGSKSAQSATLA
jgi:hypothetical protein